MDPYVVVQEGRYFYCVDRRSGAKVSYPENTRWNADQSCATLNNAYRDARAEPAE